MVLKRITKDRYWNSLKKCWKGYKISKNEGKYKKQVEYAKKILELQKKLGLEQSEFIELKAG